jgi:mRNA-degrading endonuclease HigB of HigAB toxin-antitoxin module
MRRTQLTKEVRVILIDISSGSLQLNLIVMVSYRIQRSVIKWMKWINELTGWRI